MTSFSVGANSTTATVARTHVAMTFHGLRTTKRPNRSNMGPPCNAWLASTGRTVGKISDYGKRVQG